MTTNSAPPAPVRSSVASAKPVVSETLTWEQRGLGRHRAVHTAKHDKVVEMQFEGLVAVEQVQRPFRANTAETGGPLPLMVVRSVLNPRCSRKFIVSVVPRLRIEAHRRTRTIVRRP